MAAELEQLGKTPCVVLQIDTTLKVLNHVTVLIQATIQTTSTPSSPLLDPNDAEKFQL
jgi:hypothetical protein